MPRPEPRPDRPGDERATARALAEGLAADGHAVEVDAATVHADPTRVLVAASLAAAALLLAGLAAPRPALVGLLALAWAALVDLDGGRSLLRRLVPRVPARVLSTWLPPEAAPFGPPADPPRIEAPGPVIRPPARPRRPTLVIVLPMDLRPARPRGRLILAATILLGSDLLAVALAPRHPEAALLTLPGLAVLHLVLAGAAALVRPPPADPAAGGALHRRLVEALAADPPPGIDVVAVLAGGGTFFADAVEVLLRNRAVRLDPRHTRVLAWQPAPGPLACAVPEGHLLDRRRPPPGLLRLTGDLPRRRATTAASRAARVGWPALGLVGGHPGQAVTQLARMARHLARDLGRSP